MSAMATKKFKMKKKPKKPKRASYIQTLSLENSVSVAEILTTLEGHGIVPSEARLELEHDYGYNYDSSATMNLTFEVTESDETWVERQKRYREELVAYSKWHRANEEHIIVWEKEQEEKKLRKQEEKRAQKVKEIKDQLKWVAKQKERLLKQLDD